MANGDGSFPKIADANWWKLRDLFKRRVPAVVTPTYLATALNMGESSARSNLVGPFKKIGIIDEDGKPTDLAYDWRDDSKYPEVCQSIIDKYYPQEVRDLFHTADADLQRLTSWFMSHARCGEPAARMYAKFYLLLLRADVKEAENATSKKDAPPKKSDAVKAKPKTKAKSQENSDNRTVHKEQVSPPNTSNTTFPGSAPELHINIQLHISPESSAEQIDKIFDSMAKHLKDFRS